MEISGYWNTYHCGDCRVDFAIKADGDKEGEIYCPHCKEWEPVVHFIMDFIER